MGRAIPISGARGLIKWEYQTAATITKYQVTPMEGRIDGPWTLEGTIAVGNAYCLGQRPLLFVAPLKATSWQWEILELTLGDAGHLTAKLGPLMMVA